MCLLQHLVLGACIMSLPLSAALPVTPSPQEVPVNILGTSPNSTQALRTDIVPPASCKQLQTSTSKEESGQYTLNLGDGGGEFSVYCDMDEGLLGGGWTIIQRRVPGGGRNYFDRDWKSYKSGFGTFHGNFWLGLEKIHRITNTECHELYIGMEATRNRISWARYRRFSVGDEASNYNLEVSGYEGTAGDALNRLNGMPFSTSDMDNRMGNSPCSSDIIGGWWFYGCDLCNLNGRYYETGSSGDDGINWQLKYHISVRIVHVVMAIRPCTG